MSNETQDLFAFLQGEADQLNEMSENEAAFKEYINERDLDEDYDLESYLDNSYEFINDQIRNQRGYSIGLARRVTTIIDAYYAGGMAHVEGDVRAECRLLAEALEYVITFLEGEVEQ